MVSNSGDHVVLRPTGEGVAPRLATDSVDPAGCDLDGERVGTMRVATVWKLDPQCLGLIHRQKDAAVIAPGPEHVIGMVSDVGQLEAAQPGGKWVAAVVVGDAQSALECDAADDIFMHVGKAENQLVA